MQIQIRLFSEIPIKSRVVRVKLIRRLVRNLKRCLVPLDPELIVGEGWDQLLLTLSRQGELNWPVISDRLARISGIASYSPVQVVPLETFEQLGERVLREHGDALHGKRFAVRVRRRGKHEFRSMELERYIGAQVLQRCPGTRVDLKDPEIVVALEVQDEQVLLPGSRRAGLGGYPMGSIESAVSLISGGYDSAVASYLSMSRGIRCHFLFFDIGGREHEEAVRRLSHWLWEQYGSACKVRFVVIPFAEIAAAIRDNVRPRNRGVVMKRLMMKLADRVARHLHVNALVTGESVSQVASQTLTNLSLIDSACSQVILRPISTWSKESIIQVARKTGIAPWVEGQPEYCALVAEGAGTKGREGKVLFSESCVPEELLDRAWDQVSIENIDGVLAADNIRSSIQEPAVFEEIPPRAVVLDVRSPAEAEANPLSLPAEQCLNIPYYELESRLQSLEPGQLYLLYCDRGVMSRLQAAQLTPPGGVPFSIYAPKPL